MMLNGLLGVQTALAEAPAGGEAPNVALALFQMLLPMVIIGVFYFMLVSSGRFH